MEHKAHNKELDEVVEVVEGMDMVANVITLALAVHAAFAGSPAVVVVAAYPHGIADRAVPAVVVVTGIIHPMELSFTITPRFTPRFLFFTTAGFV